MKNLSKLFLAFIFISSLTLVLSAQAKNSSDSQGTVPLKIISKPRPAFARDCTANSGRTSLRVVFDQSGKITEVKIIRSSGCDSFDAGAIEAARKIKFTPAEKNGKAVNVTKVVEYAFNRY